jgi:orotate phosphoribosyltransferase
MVNLSLSYTLYDHKNLTAKNLLDIDAVVFNPQTPFVLTSGKKSPVYVDVRKLISYPRQRSEIMAMMHLYISLKINWSNFDIIAGGETAGIPFASFLAERMDKPMIYIRKEKKKHGGKSQIEGVVEPGKRVLLVEDLISHGTAKKVFIEAIREAGLVITDMLVVFNYGWLSEFMGVQVHSLTDFPALLRVAENGSNQKAIEEIQRYLSTPDKWRKRKISINYEEEGYWCCFTKATSSVKHDNKPLDKPHPIV